MKNIVIPILAVLFFTGTSFGQKNNWKHFHSSDFPAYIQEIDFSNSILSQSSSVTWGNWTVSFKNGALPIMESYTAGYKIELIAHNDVKGDVPCSMCLMVRDIDGTEIEPSWALSIEGMSVIRITSPKEVKFKR